MGKRYLIDSNAAIDFPGGKLPEKGKELNRKTIIFCPYNSKK